MDNILWVQHSTGARCRSYNRACNVVSHAGSEVWRSLPLSAEVFCRRVRTHARRTKTSFGSAFESLISKVSDDELETLEAEFERIAFGDDTAARDAAKREVLADAGYPD